MAEGLVELAHDLEPIHGPAKLDLDDRERRTIRPQPIEQLVAGRRGPCLVAQPNGHLHGRQAKSLVVVNDENRAAVLHAPVPVLSPAEHHGPEIDWKSSVRLRVTTAARLRQPPLVARRAATQATSRTCGWVCGGPRGGRRRWPRGGGVSSYRPTGGRIGMTERILGTPGKKRRRRLALFAPLACCRSSGRSCCSQCRRRQRRVRHSTDIDERGANDEPGQKDLTSQATDTAGLPAGWGHVWNWDDHKRRRRQHARWLFAVRQIRTRTDSADDFANCAIVGNLEGQHRHSTEERRRSTPAAMTRDRPLLRADRGRRADVGHGLHRRAVGARIRSRDRARTPRTGVTSIRTTRGSSARSCSWTSTSTSTARADQHVLVPVAGAELGSVRLRADPGQGDPERRNHADAHPAGLGHRGRSASAAA